MKITYFYRSNRAGFSIGRVFKTIAEEVGKENEVIQYYVPSHRSFPFDIIKNMYFVFKHRNKEGINHITGDIYYCILPLIGCKTVLTIHDLVVTKNGNFFKRVIKWVFWIYLPIKFSNRITCISSETEKSLLKTVKTKKVTVIYNPIDSKFKFSSKVFVKQKPVVLHIGCGWNKNLENVVSSLIGISCHLRIIGKLNPDQIIHLNNSKISYSNDLGLTDQQIIEEYIKCDIVSFPSIYEGFGMPIIEAQITGRAVLASNLEPLIEIGGGGICLINPYDIESIRRGFKKIIENDAWREEIIRKGLVNVNRFSVEKIAYNYIKLYADLLR